MTNTPVISPASFIHHFIRPNTEPMPGRNNTYIYPRYLLAHLTDRRARLLAMALSWPAYATGKTDYVKNGWKAIYEYAEGRGNAETLKAAQQGPGWTAAPVTRNSNSYLEQCCRKVVYRLLTPPESSANILSELVEGYNKILGGEHRHVQVEALFAFAHLSQLNVLAELEKCRDQFFVAECREIAVQAYQSVDEETGRMPEDLLNILADNLQERGWPTSHPCPKCNGKESCEDCNSTGQIVDSMIPDLRSPRGKYRGCWSVDLLLSYPLES